MRSTTDAGQSWTSWAECLFLGAVGEGLHFENGALSLNTEGGASLVPAITEEDEDKVLSGAGTWVERATPEDVQLLTDSLNRLDERVAALGVALAEVRAIAGAVPDGSTIEVVDGALSVPTYTGATDEDDGAAGLVPAAETDERALYLRGDGTWSDPVAALLERIASLETAVAALTSPNSEEELL